MRPLSHSLSGIAYVLRHEPHFRWRLVFCAAALGAAAYAGISNGELAMLVVSLAMMLVAEIANTALEEVCDIIEPRHDLRIRAIKDMLSATVFVAALPALGILIFAVVPRLLSMY